MDLNEYNGFGEQCHKEQDIAVKQKFVKAGSDLESIEQIMQRKQQEFIDHTLLAPEYIRDPNNFIMDLMVFPKSGANAGGSGDALPPDLHFHNSLFNESPAHSSEARRSSTVYIPLNGDLLMPINKAYDGSHDPVGGAEDNGVKVVQQLLLTESNEALDDASVEDECDVSRSSLRKRVLPHKKRISRKLKIVQDDSSLQLEVPLGEQKLAAVQEFRCELCSHATCSQIEFFSHLKQHYEPTTPDTILAAMKTSLEALAPEKTHVNPNLCAMDKKTDELDQVFQDVHLHFEGFHENDDESVPAVIARQVDQVNMKMVDSGVNTVDVDVTAPTLHPPADLVSEEFSDTEDMLEGIRDKVLIEDTCDTIDLMASTPSSVRPHWFSSHSFGGIDLKNKPFCDALFSGQLASMLTTEGAAAEDGSHVAAPRDDLPRSEPPLQLQEDGVKDNTELDVVDKIEPVEPEEQALSGNEFQDNSSDDDLDEATNEANDSMSVSGESHEQSSSSSTKKNRICNRCGRVFNSCNALKYHYWTHSGLRPHQCDICGKSFFAIGALKAHVGTHSGDRPFECAHCDRKFRQWGDLKYHIISVHSNEKRFQCEFCGKAFSRKYSLVVHLRIHTRERNYKCDFCEKSFRASTYLQNHRKIHTGEKPYECDVCSKKFRVSGDLRRHQRMHERKALKKQVAESAS